MKPTLPPDLLVGGRLVYVSQQPPYAGCVTVLDLNDGQSWMLGRPPHTNGTLRSSCAPSGDYLLLSEPDYSVGVYRYDGTWVGHPKYALTGDLRWAPPNALPGARDWLLVGNAEGALLATSYPDGKTRQILPAGRFGTRSESQYSPGTHTFVDWSQDGWLAWTTPMEPPQERDGPWDQLLYVWPTAGHADVAVWRLSDDLRTAYYEILGWVPGTRFLLARRGYLANSLWSFSLPLVTLHADTGAVTDLNAAAPGIPSSYAWHPVQPGRLALAEGDGRYPYCHFRLTVLDVVTGKLTHLTAGDVTVYEPTWSPDGTQIAYSAFPTQPNPVSDTPQHLIAGRAIYIVDSQGGAPRRLTDPHEAEDGQPQWSPDGSHLLYVRRHDGQSDARMVAVDGRFDQLLVSGVGDYVWFRE